MIKAAHTLLCSLLLFATAAAVPAQVAPTDEAIKEAVRREANKIVLRQKLAEAQSAQAKNDLGNAAKLYEVCWILTQSVGAGVESETDQVVFGLTTVRLELAQSARRRGEFKEAERQINGVLRLDPKNETALAFQKENNRALAAQAGRVPNQEVLDQLPGIHSIKVHAATLVQDGRVLFEAGKLNDAEVKLNLALKEDPGNRGADYYLSLIREIKYGKIAREQEKTSKDKLVEVEQAWDKPVQRDQLPVPNPHARANLVNTSKGRQAIIAKLGTIRLDEVLYDGLPLGEVLKTLSIEAKKRDPDKRGINFMLNPHVQASFATPSAFPGAAVPIDPTTGLPTTTSTVSGGEQVDLNTIAIKINPAITDVRLADVLDAIIKVAEKPITYSIEDYAVVFSAKTPEEAALYTRFFKVDPNTFYQGLESVGSISFGNIQGSSGSSGGGGQSGGSTGGGGAGGQSGGGALVPRVVISGGAGAQGGQGGAGGGAISGSALGGGTGAVGVPGGTPGGTAGGAAGGGGVNFVTRQSQVAIVQATVRAFFLACGVDLNPPRNVFFNERQGTLMVRATLQDLDIVEADVQTLNIAPPQVTIDSKFVEITQTDSRALGFDWFLGNTLINNGAMGLQGGTAPSFQGAPSAANPTGEFPGNAAAGTTIPPSTTDQLISGGLRNTFGVSGSTVPTLGTFTGILTDPQFRVAIHALEQRQGVDLLNAPRITTLSGRQAQIQVVDIRTIVTGTSANQTSSGTGGATGGVTVGGTGGGVGSVIQPTTEPLSFGPVLDVVPYVSADGFSIQMTIIPTLTEFIQYDDPGPFAVQAQGVGGGSTPLVAQLPLPHFRVRQLVTSANVWDGQTIVLGGLISEDVTKIKDKIPVLGDLPLFGRFFRSESSTSAKKNLVIFVTPTIIDPAGNRFHSDDEMPFAPTSFQNAQPAPADQ